MWKMEAWDQRVQVGEIFVPYAPSLCLMSPVQSWHLEVPVTGIGLTKLAHPRAVALPLRSSIKTWVSCLCLLFMQFYECECSVYVVLTSLNHGYCTIS